jgi:hypothetical protein
MAADRRNTRLKRRPLLWLVALLCWSFDSPALAQNCDFFEADTVSWGRWSRLLEGFPVLGFELGLQRKCCTRRISEF